MPATRQPPDAPGRASLRQHAERGVPGEAAEILACGLVAHVGFVEHDQAVVIPMTYHFDPLEPGALYLHGNHSSRLLSQLGAGASVCVTVTLVDGLVYSKTALYHSVNYRSVVVFARGAPAPAPERQRELLHSMVARYYPGRTLGRDYQPVPDAHLDATAFVALAIEEVSAKARRGGPKGPGDDDPAVAGSAGVLELQATP